MKAIPLSLLLATAARLACAQAVPATGATPASFTPAGYQELPDGHAAGDLNADGRPDLALVLAPIAEDTVAKGDGETGLLPRLLLVLFAQPGGGYQLAAQGHQAVLCKGCGGQYDPLDQLSIEKGVVVLSQQGGGSGRWGVVSRFRYQQGGFFLIGETRWDSRDPASECLPDTSEDTNLLTGAYETITTGANCVKHTRRGRRPAAPLRRLADYVPEVP